jgi:hypothetical protein
MAIIRGKESRNAIKRLKNAMKVIHDRRTAEAPEETFFSLDEATADLNLVLGVA